MNVRDDLQGDKNNLSLVLLVLLAHFVTIARTRARVSARFIAERAIFAPGPRKKMNIMQVART